MDSMRDVFGVLNEMKDEDVILDYAVAGAIGVVFWSEPIATFDVDVLIWYSTGSGMITTLAPIYEWARKQGYESHAEHVMIGEVPVQFLPTHNELADEAVRTAATLDYDGTPVRVVRPEYLIALYLEPSARTLKRRERAAALIESPKTDKDLLKDVLQKYNISEP